MNKLVITLVTLVTISLATVAYGDVKVYNNGTVTRLWQPKKDLVKITNYNSYLQTSRGVNVYDFDDVGNQLPSTFKFKEHRYLGEFNINSKTIYRFWK